MIGKYVFNKLEKGIAAVSVALILLVVGLAPAKATYYSCYLGEAASPTETDYSFTTTDNGMQGLWATDYIDSHIKFTRIECGVWKVERTDGGTFEVLPGAKSPGGYEGTLVGDGTIGTIDGDITLIIHGWLKPDIPADSGSDDLREVGGSYAERYFGKFFNKISSYSFEDWGWTYETCNNGTWVDTSESEADYNKPAEEREGLMGDITGEYIPCGSVPTPSPTPVDEDVCANIDGIQTSVPGGLHLDASGRNCVDYEYGGPSESSSGTGGGQVLGASDVLGLSDTSSGSDLSSISFFFGLIMFVLGIKETVLNLQKKQ